MKMAIWIALVCSVGAFARDAATAQQRRPPAPASAKPSDEPRLISTAEDEAKDAPRRTTGANEEKEVEDLQRTVRRLSAQVNMLAEELKELKTQQRALVDLERLSRAEQRADNLRAQIADVQAREADTKARLEQLEYEADPAAIERRATLIGTTRPEEVREQIRRQIESEKGRLRAQLDLLVSRRQRLEASLARTESEIERLRARLDETEQEETLKEESTAPPPQRMPGATSPERVP